MKRRVLLLRYNYVKYAYFHLILWSTAGENYFSCVDCLLEVPSINVKAIIGLVVHCGREIREAEPQCDVWGDGTVQLCDS